MKPIRLLAFCFPIALFAQPFDPSVLEAIGRQDFTGQGTFHRIGMLRQQEESRGLLERVRENLSVQARANTMFFFSDNIFNTPDNTVSDGQSAEFLGTSLRAEFSEQLRLNTALDAAFFRHHKGENSGNDFDTRSFRQQLSWERFIMNNKASIGLPLSWQYSEVYGAGSGNALAETWTYGSALELSWFPNSRVFPSASYNYSVSDPKNGSGKHKHDLNLGVTLIPFPGERLFIIPSVQYSYEEFKNSEREDQAWTPTLTVSWTPLRFFAIDAVTSYTESTSNEDSSEFDAVTGTLFARLFWNW
jgi:hypothetical protein